MQGGGTASCVIGCEPPRYCGRRRQAKNHPAGFSVLNYVMKRLAITMGEPGGIGPEVALKALSMKEVRDSCRPIIVGDGKVLGEAISLFGLPVSLRPAGTPPEPDTVQLDDMGGTEGFVKGRPTRQGGLASYGFIKRAVELALKGEVDGIVTAPISKEALKMAGLPWPGHTEMLAELTGTKDYAMMLVGGPLRVILVTIHTALRNVPGLITKDSVMKTLVLAGRACTMLGIERPRIAVSGLNPHAGEGGLFGDEEQNVVSPAIEEAKGRGMPVSGPYPPDTVYRRAAKGEFDIVVSMYHDQGLIPLKLIAFEKGVNVTVGLPFIRTSPDHGTAYDIAWGRHGLPRKGGGTSGGADPTAMVEAIRLASVLRGGSAPKMAGGTAP